MNVQPRNNPTIAVLTERSDGNTTKLFTNCQNPFQILSKNVSCAEAVRNDELPAAMKIFRDGFCRKGFGDKLCVGACTPRNGTDGHSSRRLLLKEVQGQGMRGCFYTHTPWSGLTAKSIRVLIGRKNRP